VLLSRATYHVNENPPLTNTRARFLDLEEYSHSPAYSFSFRMPLTKPGSVEGFDRGISTDCFHSDDVLTVVLYFGQKVGGSEMAGPPPVVASSRKVVGAVPGPVTAARFIDAVNIPVPDHRHIFYRVPRIERAYSAAAALVFDRVACFDVAILQLREWKRGLDVHIPGMHDISFVKLDRMRSESSRWVALN
jgi:hypothetical protein